MFGDPKSAFNQVISSPLIIREAVKVTGLCLPFKAEGVVFDVAARHISTTVIRGANDHAHPLGATSRLVTFAKLASLQPLDTLFVVAGENPHRLRCCTVARLPSDCRRWPVHTFRPLIEDHSTSWDVFRDKSAQEHIASGSALGTVCSCKFGVCDHLVHAIAEMEAGLSVNRFAQRSESYPVHVCVIIYDVYSDSINPAAIAKFFSELDQVCQQELDMIPRITVLVGCHEFHYQGELFGGEYTYTRLPSMDIVANVRGNGSVRYGAHPALDWIHTTEPRACGVAWKQELAVGPKQEVVTYQFLPCAVSGPMSWKELPKLDHCWVNGVLVPTALCAELRSLCVVNARSVSLQATIRSRAKRILSNTDAHIKDLNVPVTLHESVMIAVINDAVTNISEAEEAAALEAARAVGRYAQHNAHLAWQYTEPHWLKLLLLTLFFAVWGGLGLRYLFGSSLPFNLHGDVWKWGVGSMTFWLALIGAMLLHGSAYRLGMSGAGWGRLVAFCHQAGLPLKLRWWVLALFLCLASTRMVATAQPVVFDPIARPYPEFDSPVVTPGYHSKRPLGPMNEGNSYRVLEQQECRNTPGAVIYGAYSTEYPVVVPAPCQCNEIVSLVNRALRKVPGCTGDVWSRSVKRMHEVYAELAERVGEPMHVVPTPFWEWVSRESVTGSMRRKFVEAYESLQSDGILHTKDFIRNFFVKVEKWVKETEFDPRAIQGMTARLQVVVGPYFHALLQKDIRVLNTESPILFAPGHTGEQIGAWFEKWHGQFMYVYEWDAERFDSTLLRAAFEAVNAEDHVKRAVPPRVLGALKSVIDKKGFTRFFVTYSVYGTRASGDSATTRDNSFLEASACNTGLEAQNFLVGRDFAMAVAGDDLIVLASRPVDVASFAATVLTLGLKLEGHGSTVVANHTFLSSLFWPTEDGRVLAPMAGRLLARLGSAAGMVGQPLTEYMWSVAKGLENSTAHIPVVRTLIWRMLQAGTPNDTVLTPKYNVESERAHECTLDTYAFFFDRYDMTKEEIDAMEIEIESIVTFPHAFKHPGFDRLIARDV